MNYYDLIGVGASVLSKFESLSNPLSHFSTGAYWREYHNFQKCEVSENFYAETGFVRGQVQVELAYSEPSLEFENQHYHEGTEAVNFILGKKEGFPDPGLGSCIVVNGVATLAYPRYVAHFRPGDLHTFHGGKDGLYFLSVQSPPLERNGYDDFHYRDYEGKAV